MSIENGDFCPASSDRDVVLLGVRHQRLTATELPLRHGAMTWMPGDSVRAELERTSSLPLPVAPWLIASAPCSAAISTRRLAIKGRGSTCRGGTGPHRRWPSNIGYTKSRTNSSRTSSMWMFSAGTPISSALAWAGSTFFTLTEVGGERDDLGAVRLLEPTQDDGGVETTAVGEYDLHG